MKNFVSHVGMSLRSLFREKINLVILLELVIIFLLLLLFWLVIYVYLEIGDNQYHFYMNNKKSLELIHNVKIDKYDGSFVRDLTTEEELIRKQYERFHLRNLFKVR